jgi:predicted methyltransferase
MRRRSFLRASLIAGVAVLGLPRPGGAAAGDPALQSLIGGAQRGDKNRLRDPYRHPLETLTFFGLKDDLTVVEILPGTGGYWTEILAPYLKAHGTYYAAGPAKDTTSEEGKKEITGFAAKLAADPADYGKVIVTEFAGDQHDIAPPGSADLVVTFRNVHNWMANGTADQAFAAFFKALKPGGVLGIEEHRGRTDQPQDPLAKSGYVREDYAIALAEKAGFKLLDRSEVNANPKDTKDYAVGVWALPPTYRLKDQDHAKYEAIGESDRFTLTFVKPKS